MPDCDTEVGYSFIIVDLNKDVSIQKQARKCKQIDISNNVFNISRLLHYRTELFLSHIARLTHQVSDAILERDMYEHTPFLSLVIVKLVVTIVIYTCVDTSC